MSKLLAALVAGLFALSLNTFAAEPPPGPPGGPKADGSKAPPPPGGPKADGSKAPPPPGPKADGSKAPPPPGGPK